ncbi:MAG: hypothetical protein WCK82_02520 [Bacteroidota bacterium]|jgi:hypothetical protein
MKNILFISAALLLSINLFGQKKNAKTNNSVSNELNHKLQEKNGFQDLKLGRDISNYLGFIPKDQIEYQDWQYYQGYDLVYQGDKYQNIGDTKIKYVHIKLNGNLIEEIMITCKYDDLLLGAIESMYGKIGYIPFIDTNNGRSGMNHFWWESKDVELEFMRFKWYNAYDELPGIPSSNRITFRSKKIQKQREKIMKNKIEIKNKKAQKDF